MEFVELNEKDFRKFLDKSPLKNFMQLPEFAHMKEINNWQSTYVGVKEKDRIEAATLLCSRKRRFGYEFYAPRGILVDYKNKELLTFFVENLKKYIRKRKGYVLRIDPYYIRVERDIDGNVVEGGVNNEEAITNLKKLGFKKSAHPEQISWSFSLDLDKNKSDDEILKEMKGNTRRDITRAIKNDLIFREIGYDEINLFKEVLDSTGDRKGFSTRNLDYFKKLYNELVPKDLAKFVVVELDIDKTLGTKEKEKKELSEKLKTTKKNTATLEDQIGKINKEIDELKELKKEKGKKIVLAADIFITYGDEVVYLYGGNDDKYMKYCGAYLTQWEMIKYGRDNGFKKHNFYGISGNLTEDDKEYGVYKFKKGFGGYVEELIGEYILPLSLIYYLHK